MDVTGDVAEVRCGLAIVDEQHRIAELQVEVDEQDLLVLGKLVAQIGRDERRCRFRPCTG